MSTFTEFPVMKGMVVLAHFCELDGPSVLFSTQQLREVSPKPLRATECLRGGVFEDRRARGKSLGVDTPDSRASKRESNRSQPVEESNQETTFSDSFSNHTDERGKSRLSSGCVEHHLNVLDAEAVCATSRSSLSSHSSNTSSSHSPPRPMSPDDIHELPPKIQQHLSTVMVAREAASFQDDAGGSQTSPPQSSDQHTDCISATSGKIETAKEKRQFRRQQQEQQKRKAQCTFGGKVLVSYDRYSSTVYASAPVLKQPLGSVVRSLCLRTLSSEFVGPGREGPVMFGDDAYGFALAYVFKLKDSEARGFVRWMSFIFLIPSRALLMSSFNFITRSFEEVVGMWQRKAEEKYNSEILARSSEGEEKSSSQFTHTAFRVGNHFRRPTTRSKQLRALPDLLGMDGHFDLRLHAHFCWIMKGVDTRVVQHVLELPPNVAASETKAMSKALSNLYRCTSESSMMLIVYNLSVGNQILVRSSDDDLTMRTVLGLQLLLPPSCRKVIPLSSSPMGVWMANICGVKAGVTVDEDDVDVLLELETCKSTDQTEAEFSCQFVVHESVQGKEATSWSHYSEALMSTLNIHRNKDEVVLARLRAIHLEWTTRAQNFLLVMRQGRDDLSEAEKVARFLAAFKLCREDIPALKFLTTGLRPHLNQLSRLPS